MYIHVDNGHVNILQKIYPKSENKRITTNTNDDKEYKNTNKNNQHLFKPQTQ